MAMTELKFFRGGVVLLAAALLAGCSTLGGGEASDGAPRGTSVTRTHLGGDFTRGEVAVEPRFAIQAAGGFYLPAFADAVSAELRRLGFAPSASPAASEFIATVDVATGTQAALSARIPGVATANAAAAATPATQLAVQLKRRSDGSIVWEGRALSYAGANPSATRVQSLARAMFRDFPGETGRTIIVR